VGFLVAMSLPTNVEPGTGATVLISDPRGTVVSRTALEVAPWNPPVAEIFLLSNRHYVAGRYAVRLRLDTDSTERMLGSFEVRAAD
jgi:hypothetical protein